MAKDIYVTPGGVTTEWRSYSGTPVVTDAVKEAHADGITRMAFENGGDVGGINEYYIDNFSFIPYYWIEYRTIDDQLLDVQYALPENGVYTPDMAYLESLGTEGFYLSTDKDGGVQTSVILENHDLVLYVEESSAPYTETTVQDNICTVGLYSMPGAVTLVVASYKDGRLVGVGIRTTSSASETFIVSGDPDTVKVFAFDAQKPLIPITEVEVLMLS